MVLRAAEILDSSCYSEISYSSFPPPSAKSTSPQAPQQPQNETENMPASQNTVTPYVLPCPYFPSYPFIMKPKTAIVGVHPPIYPEPKQRQKLPPYFPPSQQEEPVSLDEDAGNLQHDTGGVFPIFIPYAF